MKSSIFKRLVFTTILFLPIFAYAAVTAPNNNGLVGYWNFNEAAGTIAHDYSGNGKNGTLVNSPVWTNGKLGGALSFNGSNTKVTTNLSISSGAVTISAWVYRNDTTVFDSIMQDSTGSHDDGVIVESGNNSNVNFMTQGLSQTYFDSGTVPIKQWVMITCVYDGSTKYIYVNGKLAGSIAATGTFASTNIKIGESRTGGSHANGSIDDLRIYNRALGTSEIASLYIAGAATYQAPNNNGLVGYWNFNEATGTVAHDASGNKHNGTLTTSGSTLPTWVSGELGGAINFDGTGANVTTNLSFASQGAFTYSAWLYRNTNNAVDILNANSGNDNGLIASGSGTTLEFQTVGLTNTYFDVSKTLPVAKWTYLTAVYDGATKYIYVNGILVGSTAATGSVTFSNMKIGISRDGSQHENGRIDDFRVYNRALSATEIANLYKEGATQFQTSSPTLTTGSSLLTGLAGLWTMDGVDTNWKTDTETDRSGNGNTGTLVNLSTTTTPIAGKIGQAFYFTGSNSAYIDAGLAGNFSGNFTAVAWVKKASPITGNYTIMGNRNNQTSGWQLEVNNAAHLTVRALNGGSQPSVAGSVAIPVNQWTMVAATVSDTSTNGTKLYVNGSLDTQGTLTSTPATGSQPFRIDYIGVGSGGASWDGGIDEVRLYNRVLSASELKQLYLLGH
jgi:hypothetical protein